MQCQKYQIHHLAEFITEGSALRALYILSSRIKLEVVETTYVLV
jgi:hypothetical protein